MTARVRDRLTTIAGHLEDLEDAEPTASTLVRRLDQAAQTRLPPGVTALLDDDERTRTLALVETYLGAWCHMLLDADRITYTPATAPAQARTIAAHAEWFTGHDDVRFALDFADDVAELAAQVTALATRGRRVLRTPKPCPDPGCSGHLTATVPGDGHLRCDRARRGCEALVAFDTWAGAVLVAA